MSSFEQTYDFDAASAAWMANKLHRGASMAYRCEVTTAKGTQCTKPAVELLFMNHLAQPDGPKPATITTLPPADTLHMCKSHRKYGKK